MPAYKDEKYKTWYCQFWYVDWQGVRRHKVKRGFKTKREANEFESQFRNSEIVDSDITLENLYKNYKETKMESLKYTTKNTKENIISNHILPYLGKKRIVDISPNDIIRWQNQIKKKGYSETYLKSINTQFSCLLNFAVNHYKLKKNPCHITGSMGSKKPTDEMQIWTLDEFNQFISVVKEPRYHLAFNILFWCGLRKAELMALTPTDILDTQEINIIKNGAWDKGTFMVTTAKTKKSRRKVSMPEFLYQECKDYIKRLYGIQKNDRIFDFSSNATLNKALERYATRAGVKVIRIHDLRHSHVALCIEMKMDILLISNRLGHENIEITLNTYGHLYPNKQDCLAAELNKIAQRKNN